MDIVQLIMLVTAGAVIYMIYKQVDSGSFQQIHKDRQEEQGAQPAQNQTLNSAENSSKMDDNHKQKRIEELLNKTDELVSQEDFQEAKKSIEAALILQENSDNLMRQGFILKNLNQYSEAIESFDKVLELEPQNDMAYLFKAQIHTQTKEYDKAAQAYEAALKIDDNFEKTHIEYAKMLLQTQDLQKAKEHLEKALEISQDNQEAQELLEELKEVDNEKN